MDFDFSVITDNAGFLAYGVFVTLALSVASGGASLVAGFVLALLRIRGPRWLRPAIVFYIDSMRAIPVLVVLVWTFFALPIVAGVTMSPFTAGLIGLTVHLAAYSAEIVAPASNRSARADARSTGAWHVARADPAPDHLCRRRSCGCFRHSARSRP